MNHTFEFTAIVMIGNGELTEDFTIDIARIADQLTARLEIAQKTLQTIADSAAQDNEAVKTIASEALKAMAE
ncbi:hypothetical protein [Paenibacillus methanolicus]|uniref:Uncharacterized protein n=1 Tax=Paenibacillus methanolicus TaxID=582686 RepID=A0A5S5BXQ9_9BACL|nr:hypothetical protein [Paenibacillus methanolicus]TYP71955.1 hypothetical protein BCM02_109234 [Paenibacillus methanolicus]